jgi:hypothetical protein
LGVKFHADFDELAAVCTIFQGIALVGNLLEGGLGSGGFRQFELEDINRTGSFDYGIGAANGAVFFGPDKLRHHLKKQSHVINPKSTIPVHIFRRHRDCFFVN